MSLRTLFLLSHQALIPEFSEKRSNRQIKSRNGEWCNMTSTDQNIKTIIKDTPLNDLQIPVFHKRSNRSGGRAAQDRQWGRREMNWNLKFIKLWKKCLQKLFLSRAPLASETWKMTKMKGCLTLWTRTPFIAIGFTVCYSTNNLTGTITMIGAKYR